MTSLTTTANTNSADKARRDDSTPINGIRSKRWVTVAYYAISIVLTLMFLFPIIWSILTSFETSAEAMASPPRYWPSRFSLENYRELSCFGEGITRYLWNSGSIALMTVVATLLISTLAGYGFSRFRFPGCSCAC